MPTATPAAKTAAAEVPRVDTLGAHRFRQAIEHLCLVTGNDEIQAQTLRVLLYVAERSPNEVPLREIEQNLSLNQTTTSRNVGYLAKGNIRVEQGLKLLDAFEDPLYRRRKLCKITKRGADTVNKVLSILATGSAK